MDLLHTISWANIERYYHTLKSKCKKTFSEQVSNNINAKVGALHNMELCVYMLYVIVDMT